MVGKEEVNPEAPKGPNLDISMHKIVYMNYIIIGFVNCVKMTISKTNLFFQGVVIMIM